MSLRSLLRSVVKWIRPPRRVEPELGITPAQLRAALSEMLSDPKTRRLLLRDFVGTLFPISGGVCTTNPAGIFPGAFGSDSECSTATEFSFPRKLGIGTTAPAQRLEVFENDPSLNAVVRVRGGNQTGVFLDVYSGTAGQGLFAYGSQPLVFGVDGAEKARIALNGNVGIGTTAPNAKLSVGSGSLNDTNLPVQISTGAQGSVAYYGANKNGGYGLLLGFENGGSLGTGGIVRVYTTDPLMFFVNNTTEAMRIISNGNVGIGLTNPSEKLRVAGKVYVEQRLGFVAAGATDGAAELYRQESSKNIILRSFAYKPLTNEFPQTLLTLLAPPQAEINATDREATIALSRETDDDGKHSEFLDLYNNYYSGEKQYGIRIQRRNNPPADPARPQAQFQDFVFDEHDGSTPKLIMVVRRTRKVGIGTRDTRAKLSVKGESFPATGKVTVSAGSNMVVGEPGPPPTVFLQEVDVGDRITIESETRTVTGITDESHLTVDVAFSSAHTNQPITVTNHLFRVEDASGNVKLFVSQQGDVGIGTSDPKTKLHGTGSTILGAANAAQVDADLGNSQVNIWVNESLNQLNFKVKYSNGTVKSASLTLG